jgi:hypothetical protein
MSDVTRALDSPRVPGLEHRVTSRDGDEVPWIAVKRQRNADGSEACVWEKWVAFSTEPLYLALFARWDPGMIVRRHGHLSPHTLTVLEGSLTCGDRVCGPGTHLELPLGAAFGPFEAGSEGVHLYEVMLGDPRSWSDEPEAVAALLAERGVTPLPDPPIELPAGLEDLRAVFSAPGPSPTPSPSPYPYPEQR